MQSMSFEQLANESWHGSWDGAPDWTNGGTFANAGADRLIGVIANDNENDNSRFYFAQRPRVPGTAQDGGQKNLDRD